MLHALLLATLALGPARQARAQSANDLNAEARVYFERGNRQLEQAMRARGDRRRRLLEEALQHYVQSLRVVRSRNVVFNAALALEELERHEEAFAYYTEYLGMSDLPDEERAEAERRRDALRTEVAVVALDSEPAGAAIHVDRLDLAPRGRTPIELALPPGEHTLWLTRPHHRRARTSVNARLGERQEVHLKLSPEPVSVRLEASVPGGRATIDGEPVPLGEPVAVPPGDHVVRLRVEGHPPVEKDLRVPVGAEPRTVELDVPPPPSGQLVVASRVPAMVTLDDQLLGQGAVVRATVPAGPHRVRVEAAGHEPYTGEVVVEPDAAAELRVDLARKMADDRRFGRLPAWLGGSAGVLAVVTTGLMIHSRRRQRKLDDFLATHCPAGCTTVADLERGRELDRDVHRTSLAADVFLWTTAGLGVTTLVLALLNDEREQPPSKGVVSIVPTAGGALLGARLPLGGRP
ncbi:MAG: PEGA domain-containing protein [Myxococcota bacterium]